MKKILCIAIVLVMSFAFAACAKNDTSSEASPSQSSEASEQTTAAETKAAESTTAGSSANTDKTAAATVQGVLYQLNADENTEPVIKKAALDGNRAGSSEEKTGINGKALSTEGIRSVFELNEWISVRLDSTQKTGLKAYIVPHEDDEQTFVDSFAAKLNGDVPTVELNAPEAEAGADASWGELYANKETWQPGDYDLVFTSGEKPVARILIKLYQEGELEGKTDAELEALMKAE